MTPGGFLKISHSAPSQPPISLTGWVQLMLVGVGEDWLFITPLPTSIIQSMPTNGLVDRDSANTMWLTQGVWLGSEECTLGV